MYLKEYQERVVGEIHHFLTVANEERKKKEGKEKELEKLDEKLREEIAGELNYVKETFKSIGRAYEDRCKDGLKRPYPRVVIKVPTGGGKTLLAVEAIKEHQNIFADKRRRGLVVWVVPREIIYTQTIKRLRDKTHPYRQILDFLSGGHTIIKEKGQKLSLQDVEQNLVILFIMIQSVSGKKSREGLKVFQDSGGYEDFFPPDNRYDLQKKLLEEVSNLDTIALDDKGVIGEQKQLITSLGNAIRVCKPFIIIDEIHKVFSPMAKSAINNLNPAWVLGLSATPQKDMNILSKVTGLALKNEEMIKLDMHIYEPSHKEKDWKGMISKVKTHRDALEGEAEAYRQNTGEYIRPIALIQAERTGNEQRGKGFVHSEDVKEYLMQKGVNGANIAIKSSAKNEIADIDLLSSRCEIRYIITKEALKEGWDCPFAYILGMIPNSQSQTSATQLIGRILRQPRAKKTNVAALDESYVYYTQVDSVFLLDKVKKGFKREGLEDLMGAVSVHKQDEPRCQETIHIKKEFQKYNYAFYLPVWLMIQKNKACRKFNYHTDIRAHLRFSDYRLDSECVERINGFLSPKSVKDSEYRVSLSEDSTLDYRKEEGQKPTSHISTTEMIQDLTRRYAEVVDNAFLARKLARRAIDTLIAPWGLSKGEWAIHFNDIASFLAKEMKKVREKQEEALFSKYLKEGRLELAVSDLPKIGGKIPEIYTKEKSIQKGGFYKNYLYEDMDPDTLNGLEQSVARILEEKGKLLWWFRNKAAKGWYAIQGWREHKIRPDFVVAKKKGDTAIEVVYILETKGAHLKGNDDSVYKKAVMERMTDSNIKAYQMGIDFGEGKLNTSIEAHFVEEDTEKERVGTLMK